MKIKNPKGNILIRYGFKHLIQRQTNVPEEAFRLLIRIEPRKEGTSSLIQVTNPNGMEAKKNNNKQIGQ